MELSELEKRITRLEDIEAIKQLKARYCAELPMKSRHLTTT